MPELSEFPIRMTTVAALLLLLLLLAALLLAALLLPARYGWQAGSDR